MLMTDARIVRVQRRFPDGRLYEVGLCQRLASGWKFFPKTTAHAPSRKTWPTWEACIPRWVGHPLKTEIEIVR
jgi:hypothetical protein